MRRLTLRSSFQEEASRRLKYGALYEPTPVIRRELSKVVGTKANFEAIISKAALLEDVTRVGFCEIPLVLGGTGKERQ